MYARTVLIILEKDDKISVTVVWKIPNVEIRIIMFENLEEVNAERALE